MPAAIIVANFQYEHRCGKHEPCDNVVRLERLPELGPEIAMFTGPLDAEHEGVESGSGDIAGSPSSTTVMQDPKRPSGHPGPQYGEVWRQLIDASRKLSEMDANEAIAKTIADRLEDDKRMARLHVAMIWPPALWWEFWKRLGWLP